jgi:hypothetical protein
MQITRSEVDTTKGSGEWFTGDVYVDTIVAARAPARSQAAWCPSPPGARTASASHRPASCLQQTVPGIGVGSRSGTWKER